MGAACCKQQARVDTLKFDEIESSSDCVSLPNLNGQFSPKISSPGREGVAQQSNTRLPQFGNRQQSTSLQSYSFITLQSEQHFTNFFTFQLMPSQKEQLSSQQVSHKQNQIDDTNEFQRRLSLDYQSSDHLRNMICNKIL